MFILGIISIVQIVIFPGLLVILLLKLDIKTNIQKWLYIFAFSLYINYAIVMMLTLLGLYNNQIMWLVIFFEFLLLIYGYQKKRYTINLRNLNFRNYYQKSKSWYGSKSNVNKIILLISGIIILFYFAAFIANIGTIFYFIDTVNNYEWNRWAIDFSNNILPKYSSHFPQLIPANWSICYVLTGNADIHFFPKFIMPLFFINNLLIFWDLAISKRNNVYLLALIIYGLIAPVVFSLLFIVDGNADLPVAFFSLITFYAIVNNTRDFNANHLVSFPQVNGNNKKHMVLYYLLIFLFSSMAAATKLAGMYIFTLTSFVLLLFFFKSRRLFNPREFIRQLFLVALIIMVSMFWYFRSPENMASGLNQPEYLPANSYFTIFFDALKLMYYNWGLPVFSFLILTVGISLFDKRVRYVSLLVVISPILIWMFKYSVDFRNLSFVIPFLSFSSAVGLSKILKAFNFTTKIEKTEFGPLNKNFQDFTAREKVILTSTILGSILCSLYFYSDKFYLLLFNIYQDVYKYYYLSHRITYFIEYDFQLHVDFYQRIFLVITITIFILTIFIVSRVRLRTIGIIIILLTIVLNFTFIKKGDIIQHQTEAFLKVDSRNNYYWIKTILDREFSPLVYTNFKPILNDKIPREVNFRFVKNISNSTLTKLEKLKSYLFLWTSTLDNKSLDYINNKIEAGQYRLLLNEEDYLFLLIHPIPKNFMTSKSAMVDPHVLKIMWLS